MSDNLQNKLYIFSVISKIKNRRLQKAVLNEFLSDHSFFNALKEIAINTLNGKIKLTLRQKKNLVKLKKGLKIIARNKKNKSKIVNNLHGGFWTYLLPIVFELFRKI